MCETKRLLKITQEESCREPMEGSEGDHEE